MTTIGKYTLIKTIGIGSYSKVKLAKDENGNFVALKIMKRTSDVVKSKDYAMFFNEIGIKAMKELEHQYILNLLDYSNKCTAMKDDGTVTNVSYIALEYAESGEMFDYISETGKFSECEARYFFHQLIQVLEFIHVQGYCHRDLKPENLLLDKNFNIKIADFGFACKEEVCHSK